MERSKLIGLCHRRVRDRESALRSGAGKWERRILIGLLACGQRDLESGGGGGVRLEVFCSCVLLMVGSLY